MAIDPPWRLDPLQNIIDFTGRRTPRELLPPLDGNPDEEGSPEEAHWELVEWYVIPAASWGNSFPGTAQYATGLAGYTSTTQAILNASNAASGYEWLSGLAQGGVVLAVFPGGVVVSKVYFSLYRWTGGGAPTGPAPLDPRPLTPGSVAPVTGYTGL